MGDWLLKKLKIGYFPLSTDLSHPGDRRRLPAWAKDRGHEVVLDLTQKIDILIITEAADFGQFAKWSKSSVPIILDLVDGYLAKTDFAQDLGRGISKLALGQLTGFPNTYSHFVKNLCNRADAVVCSSLEQKLTISPFNMNTHVILDMHDEFPIGFYTPSKNQKGQSIFWEGMPATVRGLKIVDDAILRLNKSKDASLRIVTDKQSKRYLNKIGNSDTLHLIAKTLPNSSRFTEIFSWTLENILFASEFADLGILPVNLNDPIQSLKPENRLLIMWRLGVPCLVSPSASYARLANSTNTNITCNSPSEWFSSMNEVLSNHSFAEDLVVKGKRYLEEFHTKEILWSKWDSLCESVL
jgi:hypothetical protein